MARNVPVPESNRPKLLLPSPCKDMRCWPYQMKCCAADTKGLLILRYDDDGCSVAFSEILQYMAKKCEKCGRACRVQFRNYGIRVVFQARGVRSIGDRGKMSLHCHNPLTYWQAQTRQWSHTELPPAKERERKCGAVASQSLHSFTTLVPS
jgi:hypothetical protein